MPHSNDLQRHGGWSHRLVLIESYARQATSHLLIQFHRITVFCEERWVPSLYSKASRKRPFDRFYLRPDTHQHFEDQYTEGIPIDTLVITLRLHHLRGDCRDLDISHRLTWRCRTSNTDDNQEYHLPSRSSDSATYLIAWQPLPHSHNVQVISGTYFANPKSVTLTWPSAPNNRFSGLRSR